MYDVIIVGAGPAGISAGLYAKMAGANVLILYYGESNLNKTSKIENYYGFPNGIAGNELYELGIEQADNIGIEVKKEEVINIYKDKYFKVETENMQYESKAVVLATGNKKVRPNIKGIEQYEGRGISYCAICDGFFYKDKSVAVIGNGNYAINEAKHLKNNSNNVIILTNGENLPFETNFDVNVKRIKEIHGEEKVSFIEFEDKSTLKIDGIFIALGQAGAIDFARKIGVITNKDSIIVNEKMQTNIEGLYACGNSTGGLLQICKAVYEGAEAGLSTVDFIKNIK